MLTIVAPTNTKYLPRRVVTKELCVPSDLVDKTSKRGVEVGQALDTNKRSQLGQFFTPADVARFMASMFRAMPEDLHLLDAGAGLGTLTSAVVEDICLHSKRPRSLTIDAYEMDPLLVPEIMTTIESVRTVCAQSGVRLVANVYSQDFVKAAALLLSQDNVSEAPQYDRVILNPPYLKIRSDSEYRRLLRSIGIEASNLYAGFLAIAASMLKPGGELVAITPRSFCNGPYFKKFRKLFLNTMTLRCIHVFESRDRAFSLDGVLQETIGSSGIHVVDKVERRLVA